MKKTISKVTAAVCAGALGAAMCATPALAITYGGHDNGNGTHTYGVADTTEDPGNHSLSTQAPMLVWVDANGNGTGAPTLDSDGNVNWGAPEDGDVVEGTWFVTIPDMLALTKDGNDGQPGTYTGTATIKCGGTIGTAQTLKVTSSAVTMTDAKGWSSDVAATVTDSNTAGLSYSQVAAGAADAPATYGTTTISADLGAGQWSGIDTYTIQLINA